MMAILDLLWYNAEGNTGKHLKDEGKQMLFDKALVKEKLMNWQGALQQFSLPAWEEFPALPLYMDQVIYLLNQYLSVFSDGESDERQVTPAMINNYVKLKIIPAPVKKRYSRLHLAYLVIVCVLKQILNTSEIRKILPIDLGEEEARESYAAFIRIYRDMAVYYMAELQKAAEPVFREEDQPVTHLIFKVAAAANLSKMLTEQMISLREEAPSPNDEA